MKRKRAGRYVAASLPRGDTRILSTRSRASKRAASGHAGLNRPRITVAMLLRICSTHLL